MRFPRPGVSHKIMCLYLSQYRRFAAFAFHIFSGYHTLVPTKAKLLLENFLRCQASIQQSRNFIQITPLALRRLDFAIADDANDLLTLFIERWLLFNIGFCLLFVALGSLKMRPSSITGFNRREPHGFGVFQYHVNMGQAIRRNAECPRTRPFCATGQPFVTQAVTYFLRCTRISVFGRIV